jgi:hypothetical protein
MPGEKVRIRILIDKALLDEVDRLVRPRRRSEFIADTVAKKVAQERLLKAALEVGGSLENVDIPGWETPESTVEWVRALRRESEEGMLRDWGCNPPSS